jgi:hypothetical protein
MFKLHPLLTQISKTYSVKNYSHGDIEKGISWKCDIMEGRKTVLSANQTSDVAFAHITVINQAKTKKLLEKIKALEFHKAVISNFYMNKSFNKTFHQQDKRTLSDKCSMYAFLELCLLKKEGMYPPPEPYQ